MSRKKLRNRRFFRLHPGNLYEEGKRKTPVFKALHLLREPLKNITINDDISEITSLHQLKVGLYQKQHK